MAQRKTLNEKQVALLRWIGDGCPAGVMSDEFHRISAAALRTRGLVTISGRGPTWVSSITGAGREYLERVDGPDPPSPRQANVSVTQQLVDDLVAAGGVLRLPRKSWGQVGGVDYEQRARLAERYGKVPAGKRMTVTTVSRDELEIELLDAPGYLASRAELTPVKVPERVARFHPVAREFRDRSGRHEVSRVLLPRATRIVHAIAVEAEQRGWTASSPAVSKNGYGRETWTGAKDGHLEVIAGDQLFWFRLQEEGVHSRGFWEAEVERYRNVSNDWVFYRDRVLPRGPYDAEAKGRLKLELHTSQSWIYGGRQSRWADRQSWQLEERLSHVFREIEERIAEAARVAKQQRIAGEKAAEEAKRAAEARERQWHVLIEQARERLIETNRIARLREQAEAWREAESLRHYCDALERAYGDRSETGEWLAWARGYLARIDPLREPPTMPEPPEATTYALQQHLPDGWSADGPEHSPPRPVQPFQARTW